MRCALWWLRLLFAYAREGSLDSLVADTLCLDLDLLGSIFVPEGYKSPRGFQLVPSPPPSPSHPTKGIADSGLFLPLLMSSCFCFCFLLSSLFVLSPSVGARLFPTPAKFWSFPVLTKS